jgi:glutamate-1-semialdehyde 2,1-aminomutase
VAELAGWHAGADRRARSADQGLRKRALAVIPGGMYGHQDVGPLPAEYPQFMRSGRGARVWESTATSTST